MKSLNLAFFLEHNLLFVDIGTYTMSMISDVSWCLLRRIPICAHFGCCMYISSSDSDLQTQLFSHAESVIRPVGLPRHQSKAVRYQDLVSGDRRYVAYAGQHVTNLKVAVRPANEI